MISTRRDAVGSPRTDMTIVRPRTDRPSAKTRRCWAPCVAVTPGRDSVVAVEERGSVRCADARDPHALATDDSRTVTAICAARALGITRPCRVQLKMS
jgi:hypothetical protein